MNTAKWAAPDDGRSAPGGTAVTESRTAELSAAQWDRIRTGIIAAGMNPCLYLTSPTTGGIDTIEPLCTLRPVT
ncbi:hypothetical protein [Nocardia sp. GAS34]|uniref:hypothetical protein n=1 Tax=Nocardia sp. GAS34 TaxID=3156305 RepID=UPI003D256CA1